MHYVHLYLYMSAKLYCLPFTLGLVLTGSPWLTWLIVALSRFLDEGVRLLCVCVASATHHLIQASHCDNLSNRKETQTQLYSEQVLAGPSCRPVSLVQRNSGLWCPPGQGSQLRKRKGSGISAQAVTRMCWLLEKVVQRSLLFLF